jgi:hypothetical protein
MFEASRSNVLAQQYAAVGSVVGTAAGFQHGAKGRKVGVVAHVFQLVAKAAFVLFQQVATFYFHHWHTSTILLAIGYSYIIGAGTYGIGGIFGSVAHLCAVDDKAAVYNTAVARLSFQCYFHDWFEL